MNREIIIDGDTLKVPLYSQKGEFYGYALASLCDLEAIRSISWTLSSQGYVVGRHKPTQRVLKMNRFILFGAGYDKRLVDHRNRDKMDNRRGNLRLCDPGGNSKNTSIGKNNTSGAKGVSKSFNGTRWRARIWIDRKEKHLGVFDTPEQAAAAYDKAARELHGEFASPNAELLAQQQPKMAQEAA